MRKPSIDYIVHVDTQVVPPCLYCMHRRRALVDRVLAAAVTTTLAREDR